MFCASVVNGLIPSNTTFLGDVLFQSNTAGMAGGAIYTQGQQTQVAQLLLDGVRTNFELNQVILSGGAVAAVFYSSIIIKHSSFVANTGTWGGAIFLSQSTLQVRSCKFNLNTASDSGGGIYAQSSEISCSQALFLNNTAWNFGGAISLYVDSILRLLNSSLASNLQASHQSCVEECGGGALYAADSTWTEISNGTLLLRNSADGDGGAILVADTAMVGLHKCRTALNKAMGYGGGIAAIGSSDVKLEDGVIMESNIAGFGGGAIFAGGGSMQMSAVIIRTNLAEKIGGGILMYSTVQVSSGAQFAGNEAGSGGALYGSGKNAQFLIESAGSVLFENNTALNEGGAVYLEDSASYEIEWEACPAACSAALQGNGVCDVEW